MNKNWKIIKFVIFVIAIIILLYLLILNVGNIEHYDSIVPTGNIDVFEIDCGCDECVKNVNPTFDYDDNINKSESNYETNTVVDYKIDKSESIDDVLVYDKYKIWDNKELRIFSNPAYEYDSVIAPGSMNAYSFIIKNNNNFDIVVDIMFKEENSKNINMQYKVRSDDKYILGTEDNYTYIDGFKIEKVKISAKSQKLYMIDWKWIDNYNDTEIGFDVESYIKLSIDLGINGV